jgi:glycosyltransferase involved in cell wall biosynthesis
VIVENNWCACHCKKIYRQCNIHQCELNIREEFFKHQWSSETVEPFTIMCNAAGYPIKGLHVLLKALSHVVPRFPGARLLIPGEDSPFNKSFLARIKENGYTKFIRKLIRDLGLEQQVIFLGRLSSEEMARRMALTNVFVVPSSIENHSSTLIEAMIVGAPCVASYVGGIPEYLTHQENGLLYRFEEYELLADHICRLFSDREYAARLGRRAGLSMRNARSPGNLMEKLISIYHDVIQAAAPGKEMP